MTKFIPEIIGIFVMQGGLHALGAGLADWRWWVVTLGAVFYAISVGHRARQST